MHEWAPIGPATALELLTPSFSNSDVRRYAVSILRHAEDDDLLVYLLQLVQVRPAPSVLDHCPVCVLQAIFIIYFSRLTT